MLLIGCGCTVASAAYERVSITCPTDAERLLIDGIAYRNTETKPLIHFKGGEWAFLSTEQGLDTARGRSLLTEALTAYIVHVKVRVDCNGRQDVSGLWMTGP